jgi:hypothetical protein
MNEQQDGLHRDIMNIPAQPLASQNWRKYEDAPDSVLSAYAEGHRDARHAAAELAAAASSGRSELLEALKRWDKLLPTDDGMRKLAFTLTDGIVTGHDWSNTQDELDRLTAGRALAALAEVRALIQKHTKEQK